MHVLVLGCGVSGLSCGIRLLEAGHTVELWARELPPHTTSDVAAAVWYPYRAFPQDRVTRWARRTFDVLCELPDPWWAPCVPSLRAAAPEELLPGYTHGYSFEAPISRATAGAGSGTAMTPTASGWSATPRCPRARARARPTTTPPRARSGCRASGAR
jgi:hypothetical protein